MTLEELQKKIYKPGAEFEHRPEAPEIFQPGQRPEKKPTAEWQDEERKKISLKHKRRLIIGASVVGLVFVATISFWVWRGLTSFNKSGIVLAITGAERVTSGEEIVYKVKYQNNTRLDLKNARLVFYFPEGALPNNGGDLVQSSNLPDLPSGQNNTLEFSAKIVGLKGELKQARAELSYQPGTIVSQFINKADFSTEIISVPLALHFNLPEKLVGEQVFNFSLDYLNQADIAFDDMELIIEYPDGFVFESATPEPIEEDNVWLLGHLMAQQQGRISIKGSITGKENELKNFKARIGTRQDKEFIAYAEAVGTLQISVSPLFVSQTINGATDLIVQGGQELNYIITYKNTSAVGIQDVTITSKLEGKALDMSTIRLDKGSFNGATQQITWKASNLPDLAYLAPNQSGEVSFSVKLKDDWPINDLTDKNFTVVNVINIDTSQKPLALKDIEVAGQSRSECKIASQLSLRSMGFYYDNIFVNSGPIPPKVEQTTTYTIKWQLVNTGNDLRDVMVSASLPPHVKWQDKISPTDEKLKYDSATGLLVWQVGSLPASTGVLLPVRQVAFQISITPGTAHVGSLVELVGPSSARGQDTFTNLELTSDKESIDTDLPDDPNIKSTDGEVVP